MCLLTNSTIVFHVAKYLVASWILVESGDTFPRQFVEPVAIRDDCTSPGRIDTL